MASEELLLRSSFQRINYSKDGVQWPEQLRVKNNKAAHSRSHSHRTTSPLSNASGYRGGDGHTSPVSRNSRPTAIELGDLDRQSSAWTKSKTPTAAPTSTTQDGDSANMDTSEDVDGCNSSMSTDAESPSSAASDKSSPQ